MMFPGAKLPFPRGSGSHSLEQWAAGAPVIGAAPVSAGKPNWPRSDGLPGSGAPQLFLNEKETKTNRTKGSVGKTMAAKNTLKYKRNEIRPLPDLVNELIDKCLGAILSHEFKASIADLITLIRLRLKLMPPDEMPTSVVWLD